MDGRQQLPPTDPFAQYWEALKGAQATPILVFGAALAPVPGPNGVLMVAPHPAHPGALVALPAGVHIFGQQDKGEKYYDRPSYGGITQVIVQWFASGHHEVLVSGNPGGGKVSAMQTRDTC